MLGFRYYFTPLTGVLFNIRSRYLCTIGRQGILSLGGWTPQIHTGFHEAGTTWENIERIEPFAYRTVTFYGSPFQVIQLGTIFVTLWPHSIVA